MAGLIFLGAALCPEAAAQEVPPDRDTLPLATLSESLGLSMASPRENEVQMSGSGHQFTLYRDSRRCLMDGVLLYLNGPLSTSSNAWLISREDARSVLTPLTKAHRTSQANPIVVVLDPGHGGSDPGAEDVAGLSEKTLTLDIAQRIRRRFVNSGIQVKFTRNNDVFVSLKERTRRAARWKAAVYVSIHMNSAANQEANGIETYVMPAAGFASTSDGSNGSERYPGNAFDSANSSLAYAVHRGLLHKTKASDRGIKRARFSVLCSAPCPAVLIECGFLSSQNESERLLSIAHREDIAEGVTQGIFTYVRNHIEHIPPSGDLVPALSP